MTLPLRVALASVLAAAAGSTASHGLALNAQEAARTGSMSFPEYVAAFGRGYGEGSEEYQFRRPLFDASARAVRAQNERPGRSWHATLNHLADRTEAELSQLRGRRGRWGGHHQAGGASLLQQSGHLESHRHAGVRNASALLPESVEWKQLLSLQEIPDQGACGSCWAIATAAVLGARYEVANGHAGRTFSAQELVDCTPNKNACGGTGGCEGATMELGLDYVQRHGLSEDAARPYLGKSENAGQGCPGREGSSFMQLRGGRGLGLGEGGSALGMQGWSKLPENKQEPLMRALLSGPVGISAAARDWQLYLGGVFDSCDRDAVVDHAVALTGYGKDPTDGKFWTIRNSWGPSWGEGGYIRLRRLDTDEGEDGHCGVDMAPKDGTACKPYPDSVPVCGMCGVLYDSVAAEFKKV